MKYCIIFALIQITILFENVAANATEMTKFESTHLYKSLEKFRSWFSISEKDPNSFVGRCFGIGRKLKMAMPLIVFGLGVVATTLVFLTIFSLKSLSLLGLVIVMNVASIASKWGHGKGHWKQAPPQNIHFHVSGKHEHGHEHHEYIDRHDQFSGSDLSGIIDSNLEERLKKLNILNGSYNRYSL